MSELHSKPTTSAELFYHQHVATFHEYVELQGPGVDIDLLFYQYCEILQHKFVTLWDEWYFLDRYKAWRRWMRQSDQV